MSYFKEFYEFLVEMKNNIVDMIKANPIVWGVGVGGFILGAILL